MPSAYPVSRRRRRGSRSACRGEPAVTLPAAGTCLHCHRPVAPAAQIAGPPEAGTGPAPPALAARGRLPALDLPGARGHEALRSHLRAADLPAQAQSPSATELTSQQRGRRPVSPTAGPQARGGLVSAVATGYGGYAVTRQCRSSACGQLPVRVARHGCARAGAARRVSDASAGRCPGPARGVPCRAAAPDVSERPRLHVPGLRQPQPACGSGRSRGEEAGRILAGPASAAGVTRPGRLPARAPVTGTEPS